MFRPLLRSFCVLLLVLASGVSEAAGVQAVFVTRAEGTLVVDAEGRVVELALKTELNPLLAPAVERGLKAMRFKPVLVAGVPTPARAAFTVQLVGERIDDGLKVSFDGIRFSAPGGRADGVDEGSVTGKRMRPPEYPGDLLIGGTMGEVKLALLIKPDGRLADVSVIQSSIFGRQRTGSASAAMRKFERASLQAARNWTFEVPAGLAASPDKDRTAMTSVVFTINRSASELVLPGQWIEVMREPPRTAPWLDADKARVAAEQLVAGNGLSPVGGELELLKPLAGTPVL